MKVAIRDAIRDAIHVAINVAISAPSKARCWMRDVGESVVVSSSKSFPSSTGVERPT